MRSLGTKTLVIPEKDFQLGAKQPTLTRGKEFGLVVYSVKQS